MTEVYIRLKGGFPVEILQLAAIGLIVNNTPIVMDFTMHETMAAFEDETFEGRQLKVSCNNVTRHSADVWSFVGTFEDAVIGARYETEAAFDFWPGAGIAAMRLRPRES